MQDTVKVELTDAQRAQMNKRATRQLISVVLAQLVGLAAVSGIAGLGWGSMAFLSALLGGLSYVIASGFFIVHMMIRLTVGVNASAFTFFIGEAVKIAGTLAMLFLVVRFLGDNLVWPALLFGLLVVLKAYVILLVVKRI